METFEMIVLLVGAFILLQVLVVDKVPMWRAELASDMSSLYHTLTTGRGFIALIATSSILVFCLNYLIIRTIVRFLTNRKNKREEIENEKRSIENLLHENIDSFDFTELSTFIAKIKGKISFSTSKDPLAPFREDLLIKLKHAKNKFTELQHENKLDDILENERKAREQIERLKEEKEELRREEASYKNDILIELDVRENNVFIKEDLEQEQIDVLLENEFQATTEYCVFEKKLIHVLVKPTMKHSVTHTFLVWSVSRLVESLQKVSHLIDHDTRDADVTFKCKRENYALEIETGTLLSKKAQLRAKVSYLNRRYPGRWMFVVSNKNLAPKYAKLGPTTQRKDLEKKLRKMLNIAT